MAAVVLISTPDLPPDRMEFLRGVVDFILHIDVHLAEIVRTAGPWTYGVLFLIIFCETGLVVTPFLPGDSLLFAAGAITARPDTGLNVHLMAVLLIAAAIIGDAVNYAVGRYLGERVAARFIKPAYLEKTRQFYAKHGGKAIVLARFIPIVRTITPFVAGMGTMEYRRFFFYNVTGALLWVLLFLYGGYFFGNIPAVEERFELVILGMIVLSVLPIAIEWIRHRLSNRGTAPERVAAAERAADTVEQVEREETGASGTA